MITVLCCYLFRYLICDYLTTNKEKNVTIEKICLTIYLKKIPYEILYLLQTHMSILYEIIA